MTGELLYFSRSEKRVILIFAALLLLLSSIPLPSRNKKEKGWESRLTTWKAQVDSLKRAKHIFSTSTKAFRCIKRPIQQMDTLDWMALGAPEWLAQRIQKYRSKGGRVNNREDLLKIYGVDTQWVRAIDTCIIWVQNKKSRSVGKSTFNKQKTRININTADTTEWMRIYGIGKVLANRIVRFRTKLGGFHSIEQVGETYGLADSVFQRFKPQLYLEKEPDPLYVNRLTRQDLARHPYISHREAAIIMNYRSSHGNIDDFEELLGIIALDSQRVSRWLPYVRFDKPE